MAAFAGAGFLGSVVGCGSGTVKSPFATDAGSDAGAGGADTAGGLNVGPDVEDPTLGGPCVDDGECLDAFPCTADSCDLGLKRCRHMPNDQQCGDGVYCNGSEVCDPKLGCGAGPPVSCADSDPCTIDTCVETTHSCARVPRDADGDGDPVWNCAGGGDCDDNDPTVSSNQEEICANGKDDNCDGTIDEATCTTPAHDTCADALLIDSSGFTSLSLAATALDYPTTCAPANENLGDVVVAIRVPDGAPQDVDIVTQSNGTLISLATAETCGEGVVSTCSPSFGVKGGSLSRLHLYALLPGVYPLYVAGSVEPEVSGKCDGTCNGKCNGNDSNAKCAGTCEGTCTGGKVDVGLSVQFSAASVPPSNETCKAPPTLVPGEAQTASLVNATRDLASACASKLPVPKLSGTAGDLVYGFTLAQPQDVRVFASPLDAWGVPQLSLRDAGCSQPKDELTCRTGAPAELFARALPAGQYYLSVGASGPSDVDVRLELSDPTAAPQGEGCAAAQPLAVGQSLDVTLADHTDAVDTGCLSGAPDSSHSLTLAEPSDVLLVERISNGDTGAISLVGPSCSMASRLSCGTSGNSPVRARAYGVAAGSYRAVAESTLGNPVSLTAFTRKAVPTTLVALADDCTAPFEVPAGGGHFKGNTANAHADFSAGCDVGNQAPNGAPDQLLHLALKAKSRVILDMAGSSYSTMLSVRSGTPCPGTELLLACAAGYLPERSYLDLDLDSGDYYVQVDGYAGDFGAWLLDIYVSPDST
ncbi:MAG: putative metal-binding motif-containing protein [Polyangiaceae bacterium]